MYWDGALGSRPVKLTVVCPKVAWAKFSWLAKSAGDGVKLSACWVSGNTYGTLWRWLHQVFISTGVKKRPKAEWKTRPCGRACENPKRGATLWVLGYFRPFGKPFCPPIKIEGAVKIGSI